MKTQTLVNPQRVNHTLEPASLPAITALDQRGETASKQKSTQTKHLKALDRGEAGQWK